MSDRLGNYTAHITFGGYPKKLKRYIPVLHTDIRRMRDEQNIDLQFTISADEEDSDIWYITLHFHTENLWIILGSKLYPDLYELKDFED